jgi:hypothetical protein
MIGAVMRLVLAVLVFGGCASMPMPGQRPRPER